MRVSVSRSPTGAWAGRSDRLVSGCVASLCLLLHLCLAAPGLTGDQRAESVDAAPPSAELANPFGSGEDDHRLLQSHLQALMENGQAGPELTTRDQEVFFLFRLYDFDRSGLLDGLELMKLLLDFNSNTAAGAKAQQQRVVSLVDSLLQSHDQNEDGLLAPSELLSPPLQHSKDSDTHNPPHQEQEVAPEGEINKEEKQPEGGEQGQAVQQEEEGAHEQEVLLEQEVQIQEVEQNELQHPEALQQGQHEVPVHLGQPEM